jgi:hypothetical protein
MQTSKSTNPMKGIIQWKVPAEADSVQRAEGVIWHCVDLAKRGELYGLAVLGFLTMR